MNRTMPPVVGVDIHASQFPETVRRELLRSLRERRLNHKFLYDSFRQAQKWLALHECCSPAQTDPDCRRIYDESFYAAGAHLSAQRIHLIGLGCGGGQKEARMLEHFQRRGKELVYTPCDVSVSLALVAREVAGQILPAEQIHPLVCDLALAEDLPACFARHAPGDAARVVTFFGMIPNFEPNSIIPRLSALLQPGDRLMFSANLAPGEDYASGVARVLPLYDNQPARDWLMTFLIDLGIDAEDGELKFCIRESNGLRRIEAWFHFHARRVLRVYGEDFEFHAGDTMRLFYSYRYTPELARNLLEGHGIKVVGQWITSSGEEGVFLCEKLADAGCAVGTV